MPTLRATPNRTKPPAPQTGSGMTPPAYLTPGEVAELLRTTRTAVYTMVQRGRLPGVRKVGRRILVRRVELLRWIEARATPARASEAPPDTGEPSARASRPSAR